jgi:hypothetical protein
MIVLLAAAALTIASACAGEGGGDSEPAGSASSDDAQVRGTWVAIVATADDPNTLQPDYDDLDVSSYPEVRKTLSVTACFNGLPQEAARAHYVIALDPIIHVVR